VRKLYANAKAGINRINWDLKISGTSPIRLKDKKFDALKTSSSMFLALPGKYSIEISLVNNGIEEKLTDKIFFNAKTLNNKIIKVEDKLARQDFYNKVSEQIRVVYGSDKLLTENKNKMEFVKQAIQNSNNGSVELLNMAFKISSEIHTIDFKLNGPVVEASWEEVPPDTMPINVRFNEIIEGLWQSSSAPTTTQLKDYELIKNESNKIVNSLIQIGNRIKEIEEELDEIKAPYTPGRIIKE
jgi:hypothetical protein